MVLSDLAIVFQNSLIKRLLDGDACISEFFFLWEKCDGWVLKGKKITDTLTGNVGTFCRRGTIFRCINLVRGTVVDERLLYPLG